MENNIGSAEPYCRGEKGLWHLSDLKRGVLSKEVEPQMQVIMLERLWLANLTEWWPNSINIPNCVMASGLTSILLPPLAVEVLDELSYYGFDYCHRFPASAGGVVALRIGLANRYMMRAEIAEALLSISTGWKYE